MAIKHIRFDWAMKRLLRNKANFEVLEGFMSELLYEDIFIQEEQNSSVCIKMTHFNYQKYKKKNTV